MKVVIQRVKEAKVEVENKVVGKIEKGFLVFLGITHTDTKEQADYLVKKLCNLRVFTDREGKMNLGLSGDSGYRIRGGCGRKCGCTDGNQQGWNCDIGNCKPGALEYGTSVFIHAYPAKCG